MLSMTVQHLMTLAVMTTVKEEHVKVRVGDTILKTARLSLPPLSWHECVFNL